MKDFRQLKVWHKSHELTIEVYKTTSYFPSEEKYGLVSQIRRACVSIPTNIAEGCGRNSEADFAIFLEIAYGSASEVEYLLLLSNDINIVNSDKYTQLIDKLNEIKRMLATLIRKIRNG